MFYINRIAQGATARGNLPNHDTLTPAPLVDTALDHTYMFVLRQGWETLRDLVVMVYESANVRRVPKSE